ncbi:FKBP-type peptidyl-prolyl cis-trans isomerase [Hymenobacter sp. BT635]|uniref:Peptidyl-prolyl cis-trans isomerase n=1 Tax=Hymenobacter nitidus TaxID=2880929 RepID=A0ABS8AHM9_9BACT|nr:FKBP-type peptidyl-prolyl cis-trans isomerase [Hymenobacter nitidus]MCB2379356.1 FKBP-type peptidyl-prolyl cis-trans isomerase [Hymenobacter nitidus]
MLQHFSFRPLASRLLAILGAISLLTACKDEEVKDYTAIDEAIIKQYVADNKLADAQRQASGLYFIPTSTTTGVQPKQGQTVSVSYTGMLLNGTVFDASSRRNNGAPFEFVLGKGEVIKGWDEGIGLMTKGSKAILLLPSAQGYGARPAGAIPANSVTRFDVELVDVK